MSDSLKEKLFDRMLQVAVTPYRISHLIAYFSDSTSGPHTIEDVFDGADHAELIGQTLGDLSREEVKDLFRPVLADALCKALGAKNVTIDW